MGKSTKKAGRSVKNISRKKAAVKSSKKSTAKKKSKKVKTGGLIPRRMPVEEYVSVLSILPADSVIGVSRADKDVRFYEIAVLGHKPVYYVGRVKQKEIDGCVRNIIYDFAFGLCDNFALGDVQFEEMADSSKEVLMGHDSCPLVIKRDEDNDELNRFLMAMRRISLSDFLPEDADVVLYKAAKDVRLYGVRLSHGYEAFAACQVNGNGEYDPVNGWGGDYNEINGHCGAENVMVFIGNYEIAVQDYESLLQASSVDRDLPVVIDALVEEGIEIVIA